MEPTHRLCVRAGEFEADGRRRTSTIHLALRRLWAVSILILAVEQPTLRLLVIETELRIASSLLVAANLGADSHVPTVSGEETKGDNLTLTRPLQVCEESGGGIILGGRE